MSGHIIRISNGQEVDLTQLSVSQLDDLHYKEEVFCAAQAKRQPPFSVEREHLLSQGTALVTQIMRERESRSSYGVSQATVDLLCELVRRKQAQRQGDPVIFYEAGVGEGFAMEQLLNFPELSFRGCDVYLSERVRKLLQSGIRAQIRQATLFNDIQDQPDKSIDIFYADNVFEHLFPDEADRICSEISKKLKTGAAVVLVIPNRYVGPHDISKKFLPRGSAAEGFHFMELTYRETARLMRRHGIENSIFLRSVGRPHHAFRIAAQGQKGKLWNEIKSAFEPIFFKLPNFVLRRYMWRGIYDTYVMEKVE